MDAPIFVEADAQAIIDQMVSSYETMTGRVLQPAQVERLLINAFAYREYLIRTQINDASKLNLVSFSRAPYLDFLGELVGVHRLLASYAVCTLKLTFTTGHGALIIPAGVRVQSIDGKAIFAIDNDTIVGASIDEIEATATCLTVGNLGNYYAIGTVNIILDPQAYLINASNTEITAGGADQETDDELRERIKLAPQSFSNAGSIGAYKYFAKSANAGIVDVSITSPVPGQVNIYPLMEDGALPNSAVLAEVLAVCNGEKIRPLTDTVLAMAPAVVNYDITVELILFTGSVAGTAISECTTNLQKYTDSRKAAIGKDVVIDQIIKSCMLDSVYEVHVISPTTTAVVGDDEVAICSTITVTIGGYSDE